MKKVRLGDTDIVLGGTLAELPWVKVSRRSAPSEDASAGEVAYNVRTAEDMARALRRQSLKPE